MDISKRIKSLPTSPGVYIFKDEKGGVLYVGKAASLRDRVGSYFQNRNGAARPIEIYISEVKDLETKMTDTVLEAYILEQELIKKIQPKYNAMGKDNKSFCYVLVTREEFPRFVVLRKTELEEVKSQSSKVKTETQNSKVFKKIQNTKYRIRATKIYGPYTSRYAIETVLKILRRIFPYHNKPQKTEKGCLDYQLGTCPGPYDGAISRELYLKNIRAIRMILEGKKKNLLHKMKKEMEVCSEECQYECAAQLRNQIFALQHIQDIALISKRDENFKFQISNFKSISNDKISNFKKIRIEGYDISNISGRHATGSMVVFDNSDAETQNFASLRPNKSQYRKFRIKTIEGANDVGAMAEVIRRRFGNNWPRPDLIVLDGGKGHLNAVRKIMTVYKIEVPILAVAKGPTRKKLDMYYFGTVPQIPKDVLEQVRDEAHRFAISYHKKLRAKSMKE